VRVRVGAQFPRFRTPEPRLEIALPLCRVAGEEGPSERKRTALFVALWLACAAQGRVSPKGQRGPCSPALSAGKAQTGGPFVANAERRAHIPTRQRRIACSLDVQRSSPRARSLGRRTACLAA
jgi:hypothetical protein